MRWATKSSSLSMMPGWSAKAGDRRWIVFRKDGQDHALAFEPQELRLHGFKRIAGEIIAALQAMNAIFPKDTAPHGIIQIYRQHFGRAFLFSTPALCKCG